MVTAAAAAVAEAPPPFRSPTALVADREGRLLYVAEHTASRIAVFDLATRKVLRHVPVPNRPSGLALSPDGNTLYVTGGVGSGRVYTLDTIEGRVRGSVEAGHSPHAPVLGRDGRILYVCDRFKSRLLVLDLAAQAEVASIPVGREPVAAVLSLDDSRLFVANLLPAGRADIGPVAADVSVIDTGRHVALAPIRLPDGSTGVRNLCLSPDGRYVYVTHLVARYQLPASQIERGWIQTNAVSVIDTERDVLLNTVLLDDINHGAANPWGVACTPDGRTLCVAHAGTQEISVIDRAALHRKLEAAQGGRKVSDVSSSYTDVINDLAFLTGIRTRVPLKGNGPRALAVLGTTVYAGEYFTDSLGVVELASDRAPAAQSVPLGGGAPLTAERRGEMLFHDARHCLQQWLSCSSCHASEARPDGLNWDLMLDGVGNPKNTKSLLLAHRTAPTTWTGIRPHAEASVRSGYRNIEFAEAPEEDAASIDHYLKSLAPVPSPHLEGGRLSAAAVRGQKVFTRVGCGRCHSGPLYTDQKQVDIGTGRGREKTTAFDVPSLIEVWRTAPYLHDGRVATLPELFRHAEAGDIHRLTAKLSASELTDLTAFVLSL